MNILLLLVMLATPPDTTFITLEGEQTIETPFIVGSLKYQQYSNGVQTNSGMVLCYEGVIWERDLSPGDWLLIEHYPDVPTLFQGSNGVSPFENAQVATVLIYNCIETPSDP